MKANQLELYPVRPVTNPHEIHAQVPGSKSITNRALLLAAMADGKTCLHSVLFSDDSRVFMQALLDLGFEVDIDETNACVTITGLGGRIPKECGEVYVGSAGTAARFLTAFLGLSIGRYRMTCSEQMQKRPMKELLCALEEIGARIEYEQEPYHFPFTIGMGSLRTNSTTVCIDKSSQFLSALLIAKPLLPPSFEIHITGTHGMKYVEITEKMIADFHTGDYIIEPDVSAACYFYAMGAILGQKSIVADVHFDSMQGDLAFLHVLEKMGCQLRETEEGIELIPGKQLHGGSFDFSEFSDQALTMAAIAVFADSDVRIEGVDHIRMQECDRINAILFNLKEMGIEAAESDGVITIHPSKPHAAQIQTFDDHRVAMAFTMPGLIIDGIIIENPMCCRKTFENYFECLEQDLY